MAGVMARRRMLSVVMVCALVMSSGLSASPEQAAADGAEPAAAPVSDCGELPTYAAYIEALSDEPKGEEPLSLEVQGAYTRGDTIHFQTEVQQAGLYTLALTYRGDTQTDTHISLSVDGSVPFYEAQSLLFPTMWKDETAVRVDGAGNEFAPEQVPYDGFFRVAAYDASGRNENPYTFFLKKGVHTLSFEVTEGAFTVKRAELGVPEPAADYDAWLSKQKVSGNTAALIELAGEKALCKSSSDMVSWCETGNPSVYPSDFSRDKINAISAGSMPGDTLVWHFTVTEEQAGYYSVGFRYLKNSPVGEAAFRRLTIDGRIPYREAARVSFPYANGWQYREFADDGRPYYVYLGEGEHELALIATVGENAELLSLLQGTVEQLSDLYVDITMVVGETVDIYRDYELFNQIPNWDARLNSCREELAEAERLMGTLQSKGGGANLSLVRNMLRVLNKMADNPYTAHRYKSNYYSNYCSLSVAVNDMTRTSLDIDQIFLIGAGNHLEKPMASLFRRMLYSIQRFVVSFSRDYNAVSASGGENKLTVWMNKGRDQAQVLSSLTQQYFTPSTGIEVEVLTVNTSLVQAILSGMAPDCVLQMNRTEPVNLAMRGALTDLSAFEDYGEVVQRFMADANKPYTYDRGVYALPDSQVFNMLFVRTDIFASLGLSIPQTWEDFTYTAAILQRKNLQFWISYTQLRDSGTTAQMGAGAATLFPTLLMQNGLSVFTDDLSASTLTRSSSIQVFTEWVEYYTQMNCPTTLDFYNRFRIGTVPMGIERYDFCTRLKMTAPEIDGLWTMVEIPGTPNENGKLNHTATGAGSGCVITRQAENPQEAWEYLKWWTSADIQYAYSKNIESILGDVARHTSATVEAVKRMEWSGEEKENLMRQWSQVQELPEVPGSYYLMRGIDQAFWNVVKNNKNPKDMLLYWGDIVDKEITRKRAEYGLE